MSTSVILAIDEIAETQANKHITINEAIAALEAATNARADISLSTGDRTLTEAQFTRNFLFVVSQQSTARSLFIPARIRTVNPVHRFFAVRNNGSYDVTVLSSATIPGSQVVVAAGTTTFLHAEDINVSAMGSVGGGLSYNIGIFLPGLIPNNAEVFRMRFPDAVSFNDNFIGSMGSCGTNPTADTAFTVDKNGTSIGTVTINTAGTFTWVTTGTTAEVFSVGDVMRVTSPSQDVTLANVGFTFRGVRA